jgi:hypothetical protein
MTATELRIGNYLALPTRDEKLVIVEQICKDEFIVCNVTSNEWPLSDYSPIPLTEVWLLKFGFYKYGNMDLWKQHKKGKGNYNKVTINSFSGMNLHVYPYTKISYVHQLQNLYFALTGKEL